MKKEDLFTLFKQLQFQQLQSVLRSYKQAQAEPSIETDTEALAEAIAHLEAQLREFETELNTLSV